MREEYTRTIEPTRALAAETLKLERTLSDIISQAHGLTPAEIELVKRSVHENILSQAAVRFLVGQPWRNKPCLSG